MKRLFSHWPSALSLFCRLACRSPLPPTIIMMAIAGIAASSATSATTARSSIATMPSIAITASARQQALRDGHSLGAWWFGMRRHHEEREIDHRRADLHRDHERLERYAY